MFRFDIPHRWRRLLFPALAAALSYAAWTSYGWQGLTLALLMLSFWVLLHFTKLMRLLRTAATRPLGHVRDAAALHARLRRGMPMTDVVRLTLSLGERQSPPGEEPECFDWGDEGGRTVRCHFIQGRLDRFELRHAGSANPPAEPPPAAT